MKISPCEFSSYGGGYHGVYNGYRGGYYGGYRGYRGYGGVRYYPSYNTSPYYGGYYGGYYPYNSGFSLNLGRFGLGVGNGYGYYGGYPYWGW